MRESFERIKKTTGTQDDEARLYVESLPNGGGCEFGLHWTVSDLRGRPLRVNVCAHGATAGDAAVDFAQLFPAAVACVAVVREGGRKEAGEKADERREGARSAIAMAVAELQRASEVSAARGETEAAASFQQVATYLRRTTGNLIALACVEPF